MPTASLQLSERETFALFAEHEEQAYEPDFDEPVWLDWEIAFYEEEEIDQ